jgi:hypothetical protein
VTTNEDRARELLGKLVLGWRPSDEARIAAALDEAETRGAEAERFDTIEYLRGFISANSTWDRGVRSSWPAVLDELIFAIERAEHRKEASDGNA